MGFAPPAGGFVTVHPSGQARPSSSNLNFVAGRPSRTWLSRKVGAAGHGSLYNEFGPTDLIADVAGWFPD